MPSVPKLPALIVAAQTALSNDEKCVAAVSVYKLEIAPGSSDGDSPGNFSRARKAGKEKLRCLAVCEKVKNRKRRIVKLSDPTSKSLTIVRSWKIEELRKIDGLEKEASQNLLFTMIFGERTFAFESKYENDRAKFLWVVIESYTSICGKPPRLQNLSLTRLQEASQASGTEQTGTPLSSARRSSSERNFQKTMDEKSLSDLNSPDVSRHTVESTDSSVLTPSPSIVTKGKIRSDSDSVANVPVQHKNDKTQGLLAKTSSLRLSEDEISPILTLLDGVDLAYFEPEMLSRKLEELSKSCEEATMFSLYRASMSGKELIQSFELLLTHVRQLEEWLNVTDDFLGPLYPEISRFNDSLMEMELYNDNLSKFKSLLENLVDSVYISRDLESTLMSPALSDERFITEKLVPSVRILTDKLSRNDASNTLKGLSAVDEGRKKLEKIRDTLCKSLLDAIFIKTKNVFNGGALTRRVVLRRGNNTEVIRSLPSMILCLAMLDKSQWEAATDNFANIAKETSETVRESSDNFRSAVNAIASGDDPLLTMMLQLRAGTAVVASSLCNEYHFLYSLFHESCQFLQLDTNATVYHILEQEFTSLSETILELVDYSIYHHSTASKESMWCNFCGVFYLAAFLELHFLSLTAQSVESFSSFEKLLKHCEGDSTNANVCHEISEDGDIETDLNTIERPLNLFPVEEESDTTVRDGRTNSFNATDEPNEMIFLSTLLSSYAQLCKKSFEVEAEKFFKSHVKEISKRDYLESKELDGSFMSLNNVVDSVEVLCQLSQINTYANMESSLHKISGEACREVEAVISNYVSQVFHAILSLGESGGKQVVDSVTLVLLQRVAKRIQLINDSFLMDQVRGFISKTEDLKKKYTSQLIERQFEKLLEAVMKGNLNNCTIFEEPVGKLATRLYRIMAREIVDISLREELWSMLKLSILNYLKELATILGDKGEQKAARELLQWRQQLRGEMDTL